MKDINNQWINDFRQGKENAFKLVFKKYRPKLVSYAYQFIKDYHTGEGIINDAFVELFENCGHINDERHLTASLYLRVRHRCLNYLKRMQRTAYKTVALPENTQEGSLLVYQDIKSEVVQSMHAAIDCLPADCKQIFKMLVFDGLEPKEIARKLNKSIQSIYTQRSIARSALRVKFRRGFI